MQAQSRYWVANSTSNWNNTANWSATSGGAGGASVPTTTDLAIFDGSGTGFCTFDISPTVAGVTCSGYAGSIDLAGLDLTTTGTNTFTTGTITNSGGAASVVLNTTGSSTFNGTAFNVDIIGTSGNLLFNGSIFNGSVNLIKTNSTLDGGTGGNTFNNSLTLTNSSTNDIRMGNTNPDVFNGDVTLNINSTGDFSIARIAAGNQFNGNIVINYNAGGTVAFGSTNGTSTLASGKTITVGGSSSGNLSLFRFTQLGTTPQAIALSGTSILAIGPSSIFNGNVAFSAPQLFLNGCTYNGEAIFEKTGATNNNGAGGNIFNSLTTITHSGSGNLVTSNTTKDIFNDDLTLINIGTGTIYLAQNAVDNEFNGDIFFNSTGSSGGVLIANSAGGSAMMAAGGSLLIGGLGYSSGSLAIRRFIQLGSEAQTLLLTGSTLLEVGPSSTFNGVTDFRAPRIQLDGCTFNNTTYLEKTGTTNNIGDGGNIFNGSTTITNSGTGDFRFASITGDTYSGQVTFVKTSTGALEPAYNGTNSFASDIIINGNSAITLAAGTGAIQFTGTNSQTISRTGGVFTHNFGSILLNKASQQVTLATPINITFAATFTSGVLNTDATNFLNFVNDATVSGTNDLSYVDGPVQKTGNDSFSFPVGDGGYYRPISISAPANATDAFTAQYFKTNPNMGSLPAYFYSISNCEYWQLDRTSGSSNISVTLSWNTNSCGGITQSSDLRIAKWDGANWIDEGNGGTTGSFSNGTIISGAAISAYGPFTLASATPANPLPIVLEWFKASVTNENKVLVEWRTASEIDNEFFDVERTDYTLDFKSIGRINGAHNSSKANDYAFVDFFPLSGISYYRLKQTDVDGTFTYSKVVSVMRGEDPFIVFPNPSDKGWITFNRKMDVVIFNQLNQVVARYADATGFDTQSWMPGIYFIRTPLGAVIKLVIN
jgi:hypothetical protein